MVWDVSKRLKVHGDAAAIFRVLRDVPNWPKWDVDLAEAKLDNPQQPVANGVQGICRCRRCLTVRYVII